MKKNFLQDVIPANHRRSIRDVPLPSHRSGDSKPRPTHQEPLRAKPKAEPVHQEVEPEIENAYIPPQAQNPYTPETKQEVFNPQKLQNSTYSNESADQEYERPVQKPPFKSKSSKSSPMKKILLAVIIGVLLFFGYTFSKTKGEIVIYPKKASYEVDVAIPTDVASVATKTQLVKNATLSLEATSEQQVQKQATGRIKIINFYGESSQELVKNTRFQTPEGLIYQIKDSIVVPGYKTEAGKTTPGILEVEVYASSAGEEYNIGKTKFTIPGFQGRPQFEKITAESITEMTGGYVGIKKVVSEEAQEEAEEKLQEQLTAQFTNEPADSDSNIILADPETISFGELKDEVNGNTVTFTMSGTTDAYSFKKQDLFNFIGQNTIIDATTSDMFTLDVKGLSFSIDKNTVVINGSTLITSVTDIEALKKAVAGKKRSEVMSLINSYTSIEKTDIDIKPFWKIKFPTDIDRIMIEIAG